MKQQVVRKTLTGDWEEFNFNYDCYSFFVENFSDDVIYVSYQEDDEEDDSILINSGMGREVFINHGLVVPTLAARVVYIKGTGDVQVQALDF